MIPAIPSNINIIDTLNTLNECDRNPIFEFLRWCKSKNILLLYNSNE